jgi:membrane protease YdiL (CAAX protease family)
MAGEETGADHGAMLRGPEGLGTSPWTERLRGFGPVGLLAIVVILAGNLLFVPASALLVLVWAFWSGTPLPAIGFVRPASWARCLITGSVSGIALKLFMKSVVMPLLGAEPINHAYHYLAHNPRAIPTALFLLVIGAGWGEETLFRGFMFERLRVLLGNSRAAKVAIIVITTIWFAADHYENQGLSGVEQAAVIGLVFGSTFSTTGRLWTIIVAHAVFDLTAYVLIYRDLETTVAHWFF